MTGAPVWVGGALTRKRTPSSSLFQRAMASSSPRDAVSAAPIRLAATFVYIFALIQATITFWHFRPLALYIPMISSMRLAILRADVPLLCSQL
ncbi:hypothetical protein D3C81_2169910 [compost metagenome]